MIIAVAVRVDAECVFDSPIIVVQPSSWDRCRLASELQYHHAETAQRTTANKKRPSESVTVTRTGVGFDSCIIYCAIIYLVVVVVVVVAIVSRMLDIDSEIAV